VKCDLCGFENSIAARFCGGCGQALQTIATAAALEAERRQVCVLFCDLVGSTPLSQQLDAEDLRDVICSYQRTCEGVVLRHAGFVAQYRGDGIEVYFGYPHAQEDDPARAVACALDMLEAVRQLANATKIDLRVRIGIDVGRVVVGALGAGGRFVPTAVGETPNIAARIQAEASPGEIAISDSLLRLVPGTFTTESMGIRRLKGVERPVEVFKIIASQAVGPNARQTPFIGRGAQRERIKDVWAHATSGTPQFILLRGEPGIGKSRLLDVVRSELADHRTDVLSARCTPFTTDTAFQPVIDVVGARLGLDEAPPAERITRIAKRMAELWIDPKEAVPLLASILSIPVDPSEWPAPDLSPVRARQRTMDIVIDSIHARTRGGPILLVIEDLHWADPSTVELLRQLVASPRRVPLMALLTARPEFSPSWLRATNVLEIELAAFNDDEAETFVRHVAKNKRLPPEVLWQVRDRATGNPLFLEEITRAVMESQALIEREYSWELAGPLSDLVPASMEASLMARIDRLGEARTLLHLGATVGREFSHELLAAVSELPENALNQQLARLLQSGLVFRHESASPVYTFKHALIRDAAYNSLLRVTRQRYHARIAEVLAARFRDTAQKRPEILAHHLSGAGVHADAAVHWHAAGENAAKRSAVKEAVAHLRRALSSLEQIPEDSGRMNHQLSVLSGLAPVLMAVYGWAAPEVAETCVRAIELARRLDANDRMYPLLWGLWTNQFVGGKLHEAMQTAEQVLAMALAVGNPMLEITGRHATSYPHYYKGEYDAAIAEAQAGLRHYNYDMELTLARTFQLSSSICCMTAKASALWMQGRQREGIALMDDMVAVARSLRHPPTTASALAFAMFFYLYDRDWKRLFAFADETYNLSQAEGFAMWTANAGLHRGRARIGLGEVDAGVAEVLEWGAVFRQTGSGIVEGSTTSMISEALHMAGHSEEALAASAEGEQRAEKGGVLVMLPEIYRTRGNILRDLGLIQEADDAYQKACDSAHAQGARSLEVRALTSLLELRLAQREPSALPAALERAMAGLPDDQDRPDFVMAREVLARTARTLEFPEAIAS
jgi:class 3 adenylate cyclase/tetratricopeptide (TPR) repeat protein